MPNVGDNISEEYLGRESQRYGSDLEHNYSLWLDAAFDFLTTFPS